jgi:hypothetical protein
MTKHGGSISVTASLSWMPSLIAFQRLWAHVVHVHLPAVVQKPKLFGIWPQVAIAVCKSFAGEV